MAWYEYLTGSYQKEVAAPFPGCIGGHVDNWSTMYTNQ